mmetsp:Transcript_32942/g.72338  ORF Transcript_32942/g.72338 Transcript_32942/m.72338 type:complete len:561 (-) Transcript_32942:992-2674(-)
MSATSLVFEPPSPAKAAAKTVIAGHKEALLGLSKELLPAGLSPALWTALVESISPGDNGASATSMFETPDGSMSSVVAAVLPAACSRHNSPLRPHALSALVGSAADAVKQPGGGAVIAVLDEASYVAPAACAIAKAFPLFSMKSTPTSSAASGGDGGGEVEPLPVRVGFVAAKGDVGEAHYRAATLAADGVRLAARLVDSPPELLTTTAFVEEAKAAVSRLKALGRAVSCDVSSGTELRDKGYGGIYGVGKCAVEPPALVILSHVPKPRESKKEEETAKPAGEADVAMDALSGVGATRGLRLGLRGKTVCLVGKGIVYDTGGLALKSKTGMCGMKADMGGAAALLGAFEAAVAIGTGDTAVHLVLCLAENAIGAAAFRNDDILKFFSGKTCEINNTDAEGRLVLSDGVAHCSAVPSKLPGSGGIPPDVIIDMATLTGAQMIATGKRHAAVVCNDEELEQAAVEAGRRSGDLVHPLPYCPEFYRGEFKSKVADMKNSVKDRNNAQTSCAANFIHENLNAAYKGAWLHVDMAGPAFIDDRATGYGVGLVLALLQVEGFDVDQ